VLLWVRYAKRRGNKTQMVERRTKHLDCTKQDFVADFCFWGKIVLVTAQVLVSINTRTLFLKPSQLRPGAVEH
jgi:hypothetical protein